METQMIFPNAFSDGLSLRDFFAAVALCGMATRNQRFPDTTDAATNAYEYADAMLKAR